MTPKALIKRVGGASKLAKALEYRTHSAVLAWEEIPLGRLVDIETKFGIPREKLRPDLFDPAIRRASVPPLPVEPDPTPEAATHA